MTRTAIALVATLGFALPASAVDNAHGLYMLHCSGCHGRDGAGSRTGRIPPFAGIVDRFAADVEGRRYLVLVPGVATSGLSDEATARVLNYVLDEWGETKATAYTPGEVADIRRRRIDDIVALRRSIRERLVRKGLKFND